MHTGVGNISHYAQLNFMNCFFVIPFRLTALHTYYFM